MERTIIKREKKKSEEEKIKRFNQIKSEKI